MATTTTNEAAKELGFWVVIYRTGGTENFKWNASIGFASEPEAKGCAARVLQGGRPAIITTQAHLDAYGLPTNWEGTWEHAQAAPAPAPEPNVVYVLDLQDLLVEAARQTIERNGVPAEPTMARTWAREYQDRAVAAAAEGREREQRTWAKAAMTLFDYLDTVTAIPAAI